MILSALIRSRESEPDHKLTLGMFPGLTGDVAHIITEVKGHQITQVLINRSHNSPTLNRRWEQGRVCFLNPPVGVAVRHVFAQARGFVSTFIASDQVRQAHLSKCTSAMQSGGRGETFPSTPTHSHPPPPTETPFKWAQVEQVGADAPAAREHGAVSGSALGSNRCHRNTRAAWVLFPLTSLLF